MRVKFTALSWHLEKVRISIHSLSAKFHTSHWIGKISNNKIRKIRPSPIFSFSVECVSWCWVNRLEWKKKKLIKKHKKSQNRRPWYPRMTLKVYSHIWINKNAQCTVKNCCCFCSCFFYAVTMLTFQIKRISSETWLNYVVPFFFFIEMPKIWVEMEKKKSMAQDKGGN